MRKIHHSNPRVSIILPVKNGMPYLEWTLKSLGEAVEAGWEVIVSLDESQDDSISLIESLEWKNIKLVTPPEPMSMSEHWDWAQRQASGNWQMFIGQDDLLGQGSAQEIIKLIHEAESSNIEVILAKRAYVAWPPLGTKSLKGLQYWSIPQTEVRSTRRSYLKALLSEISYHEIPQMYTSCLVSKTLLERIRTRNNGRLIVAHPQDASLAAQIAINSETYLWTGIPFSWVGTSDKSAGLAISKLQTEGGTENALALEYLESVKKSPIGHLENAADFRHGINALYLFEATKCSSGGIAFLQENLTQFLYRGLLGNILAQSGSDKLSREYLQSLQRDAGYLKGLNTARIRLRVKLRRRIEHLVANLFVEVGLKMFARKFNFRSHVKFSSLAEAYESTRIQITN